MDLEFYLIKALLPQKTTKFLKFLAQNNFPKIRHLKRVKNQSKSENLVIIDLLPRTSFAHFQELFQNTKNSIFQLKRVNPEFLRPRLKLALKCQNLPPKFAEILDSLDPSESLFLLQIRQSSPNLVI